MPPARQPVPASLVINYEPRRPEFDPTLNIAVEVDRTGSPRNRLVTLGDSVTQGFMSGAIFRTDLSWPAVVAFELGDLAGFRRPVYEAPSGPGGLPLDFERALRSFESGSARSSTGTRSSAPRAGSTAIWTGSRTTGSEATVPRRRRAKRSSTTWRSTAGISATHCRSMRQACAGGWGDRGTTCGCPSRRSRTTTTGPRSSFSKRPAAPANAPSPRSELLGRSVPRARMRPAPDRGSRPWSCSSARTTRFKPSPGSTCAGAEKATTISPRRAPSASGGRNTSPPNGDCSSSSFAGSRPVM